jgi:RNA polymerase sigma-70 factor (ECF subfamily)
MAGESERALIERLRQGDSAAFDALYDQHRARIFSFLARMTGRRELAEDLVQETFLRLVRFAPRLAPDTRLGVWLLSVARNVCLSYYRWSAVDRGSLFTLRQREDADAPVSPFDMTSARELERRVERALGQLSFEYREVLILTAIERLPQEEIARMLQLSPEAVRQRLSRARKLLTKALERAEDTSLERPVPDET